MWMVTKITTVQEDDFSELSGRGVSTEKPEGLSFPEWQRQHMDGWEQFHQAATEDDGQVYGFARKDPETTVWLWVKHQEDAPEPAPESHPTTPASEQERKAKADVQRHTVSQLLRHLQRENLTEEDKLESLRVALAGAWGRGHTAAMEEGFDLPNPYHCEVNP